MYKEKIKEEILIDVVNDIRIKLPKSGGRKLMFLLESKLPEELKMGRDSFFTFLRDNNLLVRMKRGIRTTYSNHWLHKYTNLIKDVIPNAPHQVWVSDITYIETAQGWGFLSLITDMFSRKIIGWKLGPTLQAKHTIDALNMAIEQLPKGVTNLIHHSDRGVQYCCEDYVRLLTSNNIKISMTENGDPRENPVAERVNGILKDEWLNDMKFKTRQDALIAIARVVRLYNEVRPHLSISMMTPESVHAASCKVSRCWKNYYKPKKNLKQYEEILAL